MVYMVNVGDMWINMAQVRTVERRENGVAIVAMIGGQELALLPDEAAALVRELAAMRGAHGAKCCRPCNTF